VKFEVAVPPTESRRHAVKFQVRPARTETSPVGVAIDPSPTCSPNEPKMPVWQICPGRATSATWSSTTKSLPNAEMPPVRAVELAIGAQ
jgi:hypothetical protein